jgi:hypothetical protein
MSSTPRDTEDDTAADPKVTRARTKWSSGEAATLVATLLKEKVEGRQAESGFKSISFKTVVEELQREQGTIKTVQQCRDHWKKVCSPVQ